MRTGEQDVDGLLEAVDGLRLGFAFVEQGAGLNQALELFGGAADGLVGFAVDEFLIEIGNHHVAVQLAGDFDEMAAFVAVEAFQRHFFFGQQGGEGGDGGIGAFGAFERNGRGVEQGTQHEAVDDAAFLFDGAAGAEELLGGALQLGAFQRAAAGNDFSFIYGETEQEFVFFRVVFQVAFLLAVFGLIKRGLGDINVAAFHQLGHLAVEEGE